MSRQQHIIFDLDGTIIDSKPEIVATYLKIFTQCQPPKAIDTDKLNFGATLQDVLKQVYEHEDDLKKAKLLFMSAYDQSDYVQTDLYPSVLSTLDHLKRDGHHLYIATNKRYSPTRKILKKKGLWDYFSDVQATEMAPGSIPSKAVMINTIKEKYGFSDGFMVGDSSTDILAGQQENLKTIAVTFGYENKDIFAVLNPTYIINSFEEIIGIIKKS